MTLSVINNRTDEEVGLIYRRLVFPDRFAEMEILFRFANFTFSEAGRYLFILLVDDDWIAHKRIVVG